ncbi:flippase [Flavobacteriales bacterium 33_180_T64]|nr:flippase [Flavobacteriales bacterium 33_180_T64]
MNSRLKSVLGDSDFKEILSKGFSYVLIRGLGILISYAFTVYITKTFGASVFGLFSIGISIFMIVSVIGRLGLDINLVKFFSIEDNIDDIGLFYRTLIKSFLISSLICVGIYLLRFYITNDLFKVPKPELIPYLNWILLSIPLWSVTLICSSVSRAQKNIKWFAFISLVSRFLFSFIALFILLSLVNEPIAAAKAHFYGILITAIIAIIHTSIGFKKVKVKSTTNSWKFIRESLPMMLSSSILIFLGWMDTFVMGIYETDHNVGVYNVCLKIATLTSFTLLAINSILAPKIAKSFNENNTQLYKKLIRFSTKLNFLVSTVVIVIILVFNKFLLSIFGDEFVKGSVILYVVCAGQIVNSFAGSVGIILQMIGKQKVHQNFVLIALGINLVLTLILTPIYGGIGAASATVVSMAFWNLASAIYLKKKLNITSYYNPFKSN